MTLLNPTNLNNFQVLKDRLGLLKANLQTNNIKLSNSSEYANLSRSFYYYLKKLGLNESLRPTKTETLNRVEVLKKKVDTANANLQIEWTKPGYSLEALSSAQKACWASQRALYRCLKKLGVQKVRNKGPLIPSLPKKKNSVPHKIFSVSKNKNSIVYEELLVETKQMEFNALKSTYKLNGWRCKGDPEYNRVNVALCWLKKKRQSKLDELYPVVHWSASFDETTPAYAEEITSKDQILTKLNDSPVFSAADVEIQKQTEKIELVFSNIEVERPLLVPVTEGPDYDGFRALTARLRAKFISSRSNGCVGGYLDTAEKKKSREAAFDHFLHCHWRDFTVEKLLDSEIFNDCQPGASERSSSVFCFFHKASFSKSDEIKAEQLLYLNKKRSPKKKLWFLDAQENLQVLSRKIERLESAERILLWQLELGLQELLALHPVDLGF